VLAKAAADLAAAGVESARAEAELIAAHVLGVGRGRLPLIDAIRPDDLHRFGDLVLRRSTRVPLQHVLGTAAFRHLELAVGPGVFVPRPETELLAGWGIDVAAASGAHPVVVDLCSGTGAVALAVANELPSARVIAVERSAAALTWLRRNAADRVVAGDPRIDVVAGDVTDPGVLPDLRGSVDVVLCNPPYVPDGTAVPVEVSDHDPADAVFGGADGLLVIGPVIALAAVLLRPGAMVGIEHDDVHAVAVPELLWADGRFIDVADHDDFSGRPRFATARRV
jgi:release factor glutamine methyltransferase